MSQPPEDGFGGNPRAYTGPAEYTTEGRPLTDADTIDSLRKTLAEHEKMTAAAKAAEQRLTISLKAMTAGFEEKRVALETAEARAEKAERQLEHLNHSGWKEMVLGLEAERDALKAACRLTCYAAAVELNDRGGLVRFICPTAFAPAVRASAAALHKPPPPEPSPERVQEMLKDGREFAEQLMKRARATRQAEARTLLSDPRPKWRANFVPAPHFFNLNQACALVGKAFGDEGFGCYLVGSSLKRRDYRDVDVRFIMRDEAFDRMFRDEHGSDYNANALWSLLCVSISLWLGKQSDLPIDFQVQRQTQANEQHSPKAGHERQALGIFRDYPGERPSEIEPAGDDE